MDKVLLFNASGMQGQAIAKRLQEDGAVVIAPVRTEAKIQEMKTQGIVAFLTDFSESSLTQEIEKVQKVVLQIPAMIAPGEMISLAKKAINAIKQAGYPKTAFVISSIIPEKKVGVSSVDARVEMKDYALTHLPDSPILSATEYLENFATAYREPIENSGAIPQTIPAVHPVNYLSWYDLAFYVSASLKSDQLTGKVYQIGGLEGIDGNDLANRLGAVLGKKLQYAPITHGQLREFLTPIMGEEIATDYAKFYEYQDTIGQALLNPDTSTIRKQLGIELPTFEQWARTAFKNDSVTTEG